MFWNEFISVPMRTIIMGGNTPKSVVRAAPFTYGSSSTSA